MVTTARTFFSMVDVSYMPQLAVSVELGRVIWKIPCEAEMMLATRLPLLLAKRSAAINQPAKRNAAERDGNAYDDDNGFMLCRLTRQLGQHAVLGQAAEAKREEGEGKPRYRFDIRLQGEGETVFFDF